MASGKEIKNLKSKLDGEELDLSLSELSVVPVREIAALKKVSKLDLSSNQIVSLPDDFCTLRNLVKLDLSSNKLRSLPEQFGKLENLQHLDLYKNQLETLPVSFCHLKQLRWLDLKDNPLKENLRKVAGDCLDPKQCKDAANKVVQYMQKINADKERDRQSQLKKQREAEAAEKMKEDEAKQTKASEKKKEKERKKEANKQTKEDGKQKEKETKADSEGKRVAQKGSSVKQSENKGKSKKRGGCLGCIGRMFKWLFCLLFITGITFGILSLTLYANCSRPRGKEFIPKTRPLCQDLYQMVHTGRIIQPAWDYKATFNEIGKNLQTFSSTVLESIRNFDYVGWKNAIVDFSLTARDTIVEWSIWTYKNGSEYAKPILQKLAEWFWVALAFSIWAIEKGVEILIMVAKKVGDALVDLVNNWPTYWEKVKFYWKNLK